MFIFEGLDMKVMLILRNFFFGKRNLKVLLLEFVIFVCKGCLYFLFLFFLCRRNFIIEILFIGKFYYFFNEKFY